MSKTNEQATSDEFSQFESISAGTLAAVQEDLRSDPEAIREIMRHFTSANSHFGLTVLAEARRARERGIDQEMAYLEGAFIVLGALAKDAKARALAASLSGDELSQR